MKSAEPISINVDTQYIEAQSDAAKDRFIFTYTISITNNSSAPVTLKSRHWLITNADNTKIEVNGDGVVGQQPLIRPNECYRYTSGVVLSSPVGVMEGHYDMEQHDGQMFIAPIEPFGLSVPNAIN
ncbi:MAG: Co2+/Mg2+ efflux protein ApaG [Algicola sp.]|nr:Co2+/Mg2+ efflux protein ApaG [Algicola sp.]